MTIKDIEMRSGMTRANIRYYESLGLLSPARGENGYRDYGEAELETLLKIKLLRSLEVSLEDIGELSRGERELSEILSRQLESLSEKEEELRQAQELCRQMQSDRADYRSLDAAHYLDLMRSRSEAMALAREKDRVRSAPYPLRRFLARSLDIFIYQSLINAILILCGVNLSATSDGLSFILSIVSIALSFLLEPLMLHYWGSTPGKWLMGLYVRCYDGTKPDYYEGIYRMWGILRYGYGFYIPIYSLYRLYKSMTACVDEEELPWEDDCLVLIRDEKFWRWIAVAGGYALCFGALLLSSVITLMPENRGELTVAEFVENYNEYAEYFTDTEYVLTESGTFERKPQIGNSVTIEVMPSDRPRFTFTEENGVLTGFTISAESGSGDRWPSGCATEISIAVQSYIYGSRGGMLSKDLEPLMDALDNHSFDDFNLSIRGCSLSADYEFWGYTETGMGFLWPDSEAEEYYYSLLFTLRANN